MKDLLEILNHFLKSNEQPAMTTIAHFIFDHENGSCAFKSQLELPQLVWLLEKWCRQQREEMERKETVH